jgi:phosphoserine aminotransferase
MNLLHLPEKHHISILDGGADTCVLGQGWQVLSVHNTRRANVVGFDHDIAVEMSSLLRTDPEVYNDKKQKHFKVSTQKLSLNRVELILIIPNGYPYH